MYYSITTTAPAAIEFPFNREENDLKIVLYCIAILTRYISISFHKVSAITPTEEGKNLTVLAFMSVDGKTYSGVFIYPRKALDLQKMVILLESFMPLVHPSG